MDLTEEQKLQYIKDGGIYCPHCGSDDLESDAMEADGVIAWARTTCNSCKKNWEDQFHLTGIAEYSAPN